MKCIKLKISYWNYGVDESHFLCFGSCVKPCQKPHLPCFLGSNLFDHDTSRINVCYSYIHTYWDVCQQLKAIFGLQFQTEQVQYPKTTFADLQSKTDEGKHHIDLQTYQSRHYGTSITGIKASNLQFHPEQYAHGSVSHHSRIMFLEGQK